MLARITLLGIVGGSLLASSFSLGWGSPAALVGVASLVLVLESIQTRMHMFLAGAMFGGAGYIGGYYWLQPALSAFSEQSALSWAVWLGLGVWVSLRFVLIGFAFRLLRRVRCNTIVSLTVPWLLVEWLYPSLFPFYLANPLVDRVRLAQLAALGGPLLLSAWGCMASALIAEAVLRVCKARESSGRVLAVTLLVLAAAWVYGAWSLERLESKIARAPAITVGLVQANVDVAAGTSERALSHRRYLELSRALESEGPLDLLVWPETAYLAPVPNELPTSGTLVRDDLETTLLFGGVVRASQDRARRFNSALLIDEDGMIRSVTHKRFLIPFAEYIPFGATLHAWTNAVPRLGRFEIGPRTDGLRFGGRAIVVPICYEAIRPGYVRELVRRSNPSLLVTLANDGWFGSSPGASLHLRLARLRAVEHRRYLVRATNTGVSALVDPAGRVLSETPLQRAASLRGDVRLLQGSTPYGVLGDWPGPTSLAVLAWILWRRRTRPPVL